MKPNWLSHTQVAAQLAGIILACYPVGLVNRGPPRRLVSCPPRFMPYTWTR